MKIMVHSKSGRFFGPGSNLINQSGIDFYHGLESELCELPEWMTVNSTDYSTDIMLNQRPRIRQHHVCGQQL
jgi:hypothetical protein